jgi:hypothetical protein
MARMMECILGRYEVREMPYGQNYAWYAESVVIECECGERPDLSSSETVCRCGADYTALVREELASRQASDRALHPWKDEHQEWRTKQDEYLLSEETYWLELSELD